MVAPGAFTAKRFDSKAQGRAAHPGRWNYREQPALEGQNNGVRSVGANPSGLVAWTFMVRVDLLLGVRCATLSLLSNRFPGNKLLAASEGIKGISDGRWGLPPISGVAQIAQGIGGRRLG